MKIQTKLLFLLLIVSVVPILLIVFLTRTSIKKTSDQISKQINREMFSTSIQRLQTDIHNFRELLLSASSSVQMALEIQAQQVEFRLAEPADANFKYTPGMLYGKDNDPDRDILELAALQSRFYNKDVDFTRQECLLTPDADIPQATEDLARLQTMTRQYEHYYKLNLGRTLWHYTALESGIFTNYPGGDTLPSPGDYDPRERPWYVRAKNQPDKVAFRVTKDVATRRMTLTYSTAVFRPDGTFAGVTGIDKTIDDVFKGFKLPASLGDDVDLILAGLGSPDEPLTEETSEIFMYLHNHEDTELISWRQEPALQRLRSADEKPYTAMLTDLIAGRPGHQIMEFEGQKSIWVYSSRLGERASLVLIIPYDSLLELARDTQTTILGESSEQLRRAGLFILVIILLVILLSYIRAKKFTTPINQLAILADRLADGDFTAQAQITTGDELQRLAEVFNQVGPKLSEHEKIQRSLEIARAIQQNLLPDTPPKLTQFDVAGKCRYCDETGGDYFDFIPLRHNQTESLGLVLGDVTGHGIGAALLMASARSILRNASNHYNGSLSDLISEFNNQLSDDTGDDKFMTLFYGALDDRNRQLTWASGGHDPAIWFHQQTRTFEELPNTGPLTGYMKDLPFEQAGPVILSPGDILLIGTDGIWEAENSSAQDYGKDRLYTLIQENADKTAEQIAETIIQSVETFTAPQSPADDITLIIIKAL